MRKEIGILNIFIIIIVGARMNFVGFSIEEELQSTECTISKVANIEGRKRGYNTSLKFKCKDFETRYIDSRYAVTYIEEDKAQTKRMLIGQKVKLYYHNTEKTKCLTKIDGYFREKFFIFKSMPFFGCQELI